MRRLAKSLSKSVKASERSLEQFRSAEEMLVRENEKLDETLDSVEEDIQQLRELRDKGTRLKSENSGMIIRLRDFIRGGN